MSVPIVFFGNERLATGVSTTAPVLQALITAGYDVRAVVSHHSAGSGRKQRSLEIADVAAAAGIPVLLPARPSEIHDQLVAFQAKAGVLVAYGKIVPQSVIDIFPRGIINIHPSALPLHRGPTPLESVILDGSSETAVSVMALAAAMDAGPVYGQQPVALSGQVTKQALADTLSAVGRDLLLRHLPAILDGSLEPIEQADSLASYDALITKSDGTLDWQLAAVDLERQIRAYAGWPGSHTTFDDRQLTVLSAHIEAGSGTAGTLRASPPDQLAIYTATDTLVLDTVLPAGKRPMSGSDFVRGRRVLGI